MGNTFIAIFLSTSLIALPAVAQESSDEEEIVDLWHSFPWFPQHHLAILTSVEDYLESGCGPGGL